jgi:hypothetical protein
MAIVIGTWRSIGVEFEDELSYSSLGSWFFSVFGFLFSFTEGRGSGGGEWRDGEGNE